MDTDLSWDKALLCPPKTKMCKDDFCKENCKNVTEPAKSFFGMIKVLPQTTQQCEEPENPVINDLDDILTNFIYDSSKNIWAFKTAPTNYVSVKAVAPKVDISYEIKVLKYMKTSILHAVPHFPEYIANYTSKKLLADPAFIKFMTTNNNPQQLLVTYPFRRGTLSEFLTHSMSSELLLAGSHIEQTKLHAVFFQLYFILYAMAQMGIQHNNLNIEKNVFVIYNTSACQEALYVSGFELYRIPFGNQIYIDDFSLSSCKACGSNPNVKKQTFNDTYTILNQIKPIVRGDVFLTNLIETTIHNPTNIKFLPELEFFNKFLNNK